MTLQFSEPSRLPLVRHTGCYSVPHCYVLQNQSRNVLTLAGLGLLRCYAFFPERGLKQTSLRVWNNELNWLGRLWWWDVYKLRVIHRIGARRRDIDLTPAFP